MLVSQYMPHALPSTGTTTPTKRTVTGNLDDVQNKYSYLLRETEGKSSTTTKAPQKNARLLRVQESCGSCQQARGHPCDGIILFFFSFITKHNTEVQFYNSKVNVGVMCLLVATGKTLMSINTDMVVHDKFILLLSHAFSRCDIIPAAFTNTDIVEWQETELGNTLRCPKVGQAASQCHS